MDLSNEMSSANLLQAQAHIWNCIFSFINPMSLKCAVQLGIPDIIKKHGNPMSLSDLISALPIHPKKSNCVHRLMRILVHSGFFCRQKLSELDEEKGYVLTDASRLLLKDDPLSARPFLLGQLDPFITKPWHYFSTWFQNDDPTACFTAHGTTFWDLGNLEPSLSHIFNDSMASDARLISKVVSNEYKGVFEGLESLVDVGGGTGTMSKAIADVFPHVECIVFDLPHVVADLKGSKNLKFFGGDMFEAIPPTDAILMKWILHDWSDEECIKILQRSKEAITRKEKKGKVIIIDMVMKQKGDDQSIETQLFFDMLMMVLLTGKERTEKEWAKLFSDAGFSDYKITPICGLRYLIEVYP